MDFFRVAPFLLAVILATPAFAQDNGRVLFGQRDFEMDWRVDPAGRRIRLRFQGATRRLRIEPHDGSDQVMIRDFVKGDILVLVAEGRKGVYGAKTAPLGPFRSEGIGRLREIVGEACREIATEGRTMCLTDDGIPVEIVLGGQTIRAESLARRSQHPALFEPPKDVPVKPIPHAQAGGLRLPF